MKKFIKSTFSKKSIQIIFIILLAVISFVLIINLYNKKHTVTQYAYDYTQYMYPVKDTYANFKNYYFRIKIDKPKFKDEILNEYLEKEVMSIFIKNSSTSIENFNLSKKARQLEAKNDKTLSDNANNLSGYYNVSYKTAFYSPDILTINFYIESFGGDAHPTHVYNVINYNVKNKKILTFNDFNDSDLKNRSLVLGSEIAELNTNLTSISSRITDAIIDEITAKDTLDDNLRKGIVEGVKNAFNLQNFYIIKRDICSKTNNKSGCFEDDKYSEYSLNVIFNEGTIVPYNYGAIEIEVPLTK